MYILVLALFGSLGAYLAYIDITVVNHEFWVINTIVALIQVAASLAGGKRGR